MTAIGPVVVGPATGERVGDPVGQQLAVRQARGRVVQGAALRDVDEPRVVERDRGELGEARSAPRCRAQSEAPRVTARRRGRARRSTRPPDVSGTPTVGTERAGRQVRRAARPRVVVVDDDGWPVRTTAPPTPSLDAQERGRRTSAKTPVPTAHDETLPRPARAGR